MKKLYFKTILLFILLFSFNHPSSSDNIKSSMIYPNEEIHDLEGKILLELKNIQSLERETAQIIEVYLQFAKDKEKSMKILMKDFKYKDYHQKLEGFLNTLEKRKKILEENNKRHMNLLIRVDVESMNKGRTVPENKRKTPQ